jgi:hypothetical protein
MFLFGFFASPLPYVLLACFYMSGMFLFYTGVNTQNKDGEEYSRDEIYVISHTESPAADCFYDHDQFLAVIHQPRISIAVAEDHTPDSVPLPGMLKPKMTGALLFPRPPPPAG